MKDNIGGIILGILSILGIIAFCSFIVWGAYQVSISDLPDWFKFFILS